MLSIVLALSASLAWGLGDMLAGLRARKAHVILVALIVQGVGVLIPVAIVTADHGWGRLAGGSAGAILAAVVSGLFGAASLTAFYKAMSVSRLSVASPLLASGGVLSFVLAVGTGEPAPLSAWAGVLVVLAGGFLTAVQGRGGDALSRTGVVFAALAAAGMGLYLFFLGSASNEIGAVYGALLSRATSFACLAIAAAIVQVRIELRSVALMLPVGFLATGAILAYGVAADLGSVSISSVLGSLSPVVTIALAHIFLGERLGRIESLGIALVLFGVSLVALA